LIAGVEEKSLDYRSSRTVTLGLSAWARPRSWGHYFWFVTNDGGVIRLSPYAWSAPQPWYTLPESSFGLTPPVIYSGGSCEVPDPHLVAFNARQIRAVSVIHPNRMKSVYSPAAGHTLLNNANGNDYHAVAEWTDGVAVIEAQGDAQWLVICPFDEEPWRVGIQDSPVVVGPVGRDHLICFCTNDRLYWYNVANREMNSSMAFAREFQPFRRLPDLEIVNLAPGVTPLSIEVSTQGIRAYILGQVERRACCVEVDLEAQPAKMIPTYLQAGAFVDVNERGSLMVNASSEVRELTAREVKRHSYGRKLRASMPVVICNGEIIGFSDECAGPVVCRKKEFIPLAGDVPDCDEKTVMGWMHRDDGVALMVRNGSEMKLVSWDRVSLLGMAERVHAQAE
jgi:hypothetical protein